MPYRRLPVGFELEDRWCVGDVHGMRAVGAHPEDVGAAVALADEDDGAAVAGEARLGVEGGMERDLAESAATVSICVSRRSRRAEVTSTAS
jgi:hypothetical protein